MENGIHFHQAKHVHACIALYCAVCRLSVYKVGGL